MGVEERWYVSSPQEGTIAGISSSVMGCSSSNQKGMTVESAARSDKKAAVQASFDKPGLPLFVPVASPHGLPSLLRQPFPLSDLLIAALLTKNGNCDCDQQCVLCSSHRHPGGYDGARYPCGNRRGRGGCAS